MKKILISLFSATLFFSCSTIHNIGTKKDVAINSLRYLGQFEVPYNQQFKGTTIGGLSGIDYDRKNNLYYLICDDRSDINPSRYYTARINITQSGIFTVKFEDVTTLSGKNGTPFTSSKINRVHAADPEAVRYNAHTGQLVWTNEGERYLKKDTVLQQPSITIMNKNGRFIDTFLLPRQLKIYDNERGVRQNGSLEGLTFTGNYKHLFVNVEEPLYEDGPTAGLQDSDAYIRIIKYRVNTRKPVAQYAYRLQPIAHPATPATAFMINGVSDILWIGKNRLLVVERSYSTGIQPCTIRVFITDLSGSTDISGIISLREQSFKSPISKRLLMNMDDLGIYTDNIEGVTFGPDLPNGHRTLIFVSDNNFDTEQRTQFLLFEVD